jgi:hypothetical protein
MSIQYGYYLPLGNVFDSVRFVSISAKMTGFGSSLEQKLDKAGTPVWTISALVKRGEEPAAMENFSLTTPAKTAEAIGKVAELTPIKLIGLSGGKWAKAGSDRTEWSFQITSIENVS